MKHGEFDNDAAALARRIAAHDSFAQKDINDWIFDELGARSGEQIIELGCGTGKQTIPLAKQVGDSGSVVAVDVSADALRALREDADRQELSARIELVCAGLDKAVADAVTSQDRFDRALASFSIYYAEDPELLFANLATLIKPGGVLFFCGPNADNNREIIAFHHALHGGERGSPGQADRFMAQAPERLRGHFAEVRQTTFENPMEFKQADQLYEYWRSYNLYEPSLDAAFRGAANKHFASHPTFVTTKRVTGLACTR